MGVFLRSQKKPFLARAALFCGASHVPRFDSRSLPLRYEGSGECETIGVRVYEWLHSSESRQRIVSFTRNLNEQGRIGLRLDPFFEAFLGYRGTIVCFVHFGGGRVAFVTQFAEGFEDGRFGRRAFEIVRDVMQRFKHRDKSLA
jgi:hypothetical protein